MLRILATLLTAALLCCIYWLAVPLFPSPPFETGGKPADPPVNNGVRKAGQEGHSRELGTALSGGLGPLGRLFAGPLGSSRHSPLQQEVILFPSPTNGFSSWAPFTFNPMRALSAPPTAFSLIQTTSVWAPVELYSVVHACTRTLPHPAMNRDSFGARPFVQGMQAVSRYLLLQSSGLYGQSYVREMKINTTEEINTSSQREIELTTERIFYLYRDHFAEGVAAYYSIQLQRLLLLVLTWESGVVYVVDYETFGCMGIFRVDGIEGWGFVSSLDLTLYRAVQEAQQHAAAAAALVSDSSPNSAAAAAAAEAKEKAARQQLLKHAKVQQLWITTGGPELLEVPVHSIEAALSENLSVLSTEIKQLELQQRGQQQKLVEVKPSRGCKRVIRNLQVKRAALVHCLGHILVGLNEMEYNSRRNTLLANLYGLPALVEIDPKTGACISLISLSGVAVVERHHDEDHRVANGVAIPLEGWSDPAGRPTPGGVIGAPKLYITGKEWPAIALVQLRRLRVGDATGFERRGPPESGQCENALDEAGQEAGERRPFLEVQSFAELKKKLPHFLSTRRMRLAWRR